MFSTLHTLAEAFPLNDGAHFRLARRATRVLVTQLVMGLAAGAAIFMLSGNGGSTMTLLAVPVLVAVLIPFLMYANLVNELGKAVRDGRRTLLAEPPARA